MTETHNHINRFKSREKSWNSELFLEYLPKEKIKWIIQFGSTVFDAQVYPWSDIDILIVAKGEINSTILHQINEAYLKFYQTSNQQLSINICCEDESFKTIPLLGKPYIIRYALAAGRLLLGENPPVWLDTVPGRQEIQKNSLNNFFELTARSRRYVRTIDFSSKNLDAVYKRIVKCSLFSIKRCCEIKEAQFHLTHVRAHEHFKTIFPDYSYEAETILRMRENWHSILDMKKVINNIMFCQDFTEQLWLMHREM
ncbi:hypothetical protein [Maridesulfovibrio sp.]|uniref:hypothetical protein n=1 Tax=Maridesulfovibrio sp. TaxID=2795000 RepID=UPI0039F139E3